MKWNAVKKAWSLVGEKIIEAAMGAAMGYVTPEKMIGLQIRGLKKLKARIEKSKNTKDDVLLPSINATIDALEKAVPQGA